MGKTRDKRLRKIKKVDSKKNFVRTKFSKSSSNKKMHPTTRKFNKQQYKIDTVKTTKGKAKKEAKQLKNKGYKARVFDAKKPRKGYLINQNIRPKTARYAIYKRKKGK